MNCAAWPSSSANARPLASSRSASTALPPSRTTSRAVAAPLPEAPPLRSTTLFTTRAKEIPPRQPAGQAAIGHELRAGDERRTVGGEPQDQLAEILRIGHVADRMVRAQHCPALLVAHRLPQWIEDRRVDAAGMHRIAADAVFLLGAIQRHALAQEPHRAFGRAVGRRARRADQRRHRRDVHDRAPGLGFLRPGLLHALDGVLAAQEHAFRIDRLDPPPLLDRGALGRAPATRDAGIVDQDVEPAVARQHIGQQRLPGFLRGDIVLHEAAGRALGGGLDVGRHDARARLGELLQGGCADARRAAGDDRHLSGKFTHRGATIAMAPRKTSPNEG